MEHLTRAYVIPGRRRKDMSADHVLVVERSEPNSPDFERVEVVLTRGVLGWSTLSVLRPRQVGARKSKAICQRALALVGWICHESGLRISADSCLTETSLLRRFRELPMRPDFERDRVSRRVRRIFRDFDRYSDDFLARVECCSLDDVDV